MSQQPHDISVTVKGLVSDIFAHRFVVQGAKGRVLADIGKDNFDHVPLKAGDEVELTGEQKPSELKVHKMLLNGSFIKLEQKKNHKTGRHDNSDDRNVSEFDSAVAVKAVEASGLTIVGKPRRKPEHFEVLGSNASGEFIEAHVALDGTIRKTRPVDANDQNGGTKSKQLNR